MDIKNEVSHIQVFAGNAKDVTLIKSLLNTVGIEVILKDEISETKAGRTRLIKIMVMPKDFDQALEIIEECEKLDQPRT